jgi:hypothetical protein
MIKNSKFLDTFPKIRYDINNTGFGSGSHETVVDIFFRFGVVKDIINNLSSYTVFELDDSDTPEILAEKVYGDAGAGWIILYSNKITDPQFDWPLNYDAFAKMIVDKYGSLETAQTTVHHYEKVITRTNQFFETTDVSRFVIDGPRLTENVLSVPYSYYVPYTITTKRTADSSAFTGDSEEIPFLTADLMYDDTLVVSKVGSVAYSNEVNTYEIDGKTVVETIRGEAISNYDYELKLNDDKRLIKVIKADYYSFIMNEFKKITGQTYAF